MMKKTGIAALCLAAALAAPSARAQEKDAKPAAGAPPAAAAPKAPAELDQVFKFFEGAWKCDTKFAAGSFGPGFPETNVKSTVKFKKDLDGFFYRGEYEIKKSKTMPGFRGVLYLGYQPAAHLYTLNSVDNSGGTEMATSTGPEADVITFTGDVYMMGQKVKVREAMGKAGGKVATHKFEVDMGKGFQLMGEDTCKR
jgi:hypothetical protein